MLKGVCVRHSPGVINSSLIILKCRTNTPEMREMYLGGNVSRKNSRNIGEVKALWQLEVKLNGGTLVTPFQGVSGHNVNLNKDGKEKGPSINQNTAYTKSVPSTSNTAHGLPICLATQYKGDVVMMMGDLLDLWSIEGSISGIQFPWLAKIIQRLGQHLHKSRQTSAINQIPYSSHLNAPTIKSCFSPGGMS